MHPTRTNKTSEWLLGRRHASAPPSRVRAPYPAWAPYTPAAGRGSSGTVKAAAATGAHPKQATNNPSSCPSRATPAHAPADMTTLKQINDKGATIAWSPLRQHASLIATGTKVRS